MPYSDPANKGWSIQTIVELLGKDNYSQILDVGPGAGIYADLVKERELNCDIDAVEIWEPYIRGFKLEEKYRTVYHDDIRNWFARHNNSQDVYYDLIIFGDILEHMSKDDAIRMWEYARKKATYVMLSIPIVYYPQGHSHDNPYEEHVKDDWSTAEVLDSFPGIYKYQVFEQTGVFVAGNKDEAAHLLERE